MLFRREDRKRRATEHRPRPDRRHSVRTGRSTALRGGGVFGARSGTLPSPMFDTRSAPTGPPSGSGDDAGLGRLRGERAMTAERKPPRRFSPERKLEAVPRLLRGEDPESLSRGSGVAAGTLPEWRSAFLAGGQARLEGRPANPRDEEIRALQTRAEDLTRRLELSHMAVERRKGTSRRPSPPGQRPTDRACSAALRTGRPGARPRGRSALGSISAAAKARFPPIPRRGPGRRRPPLRRTARRRFRAETG